MVHQLRTHTNPEAPGCVETLSSTSGLVITCGIHVLKTQISVQSTVVMSSGEAELYSTILDARSIMESKELPRDLGVSVEELKFKIRTDSSSAKGASDRMGIG